MVESTSPESLSKRNISEVAHFPSNLISNRREKDQRILIETIIFPMARPDQSFLDSETNFSREFSLTIFDESTNELKVESNGSSFIEFFIERDPNLILPDFVEQNVTKTKMETLFQIHQIVFDRSESKQNRTFALQIEIDLIDSNVSHILIHRFDEPPQFNSSIKIIDGWTIICPSGESRFFRHRNSLKIFQRRIICRKFMDF